MNKNKTTSIKRKSTLKLIYIVVAYVAIVAGIGYWVWTNTLKFENEAIRKTQQHLLTIAKSESQRIEDFIITNLSDAKILSKNPLVIKYLKDDLKAKSTPEADNYTIEYLFEHFKGKVDFIHWLNAKGKLVGGFPFVEEIIGRDESRDPDVKLMLESHNPCIDLFEANSGNRFLCICNPVIENGNFLGLTRVLISLDTINNLVITVRAGEKGYAWIISESGIMMAHPKPEHRGVDIMEVRKEAFPDFDWSELEGIVNKMKSGEEGIGTYHSAWWTEEKLEIVRKLTAFSPINISARQELWSIGVSLSYDEIAKPIKRNALNNIIGAGSLLLVFSIGGIILFRVQRKGAEMEIIARSAEELRILNEKLQLEIVERKWSEERLKNSEKKSRAWLENSSACTKIVDLDFNLQYMSTAGIKGLKIDDITQFYGKPYPFDFYPESFRNVMTKNLEKVRETGEIITQEASVVDIDGNELWYHSTLVPVNDDEGRIDYIIVVSIDVTERKKAEQVLWENQHLLNSVIDNSPAVIYVKDANGRLLLLNKRYEELFDISCEDVIGKKEDIFFPEDMVEKLWANDRHVLQTNLPQKFEESILHGNGELHTYISVKFPLHREDGMPYAVCGISTDITEHQKMENELVKMQKLESIGVLAGGIAHDFNNNLQSILSCVTLAKMCADPEDEVYERLTDAERITLQAKGLSQQLLTFSRGGDPIRKTIFISELIKESVSLALSGSNVKCVFNIPDNLWPVEADKGQLNQVISNFIINANQAMSEGGIVKVKSENINVDKNDLLLLKEGKYVRITIEDQGTGIAHEYLQKIFDPYFTTKEKGNGLGLATCYSIIKKHDGYIDVESEVGIGTVFHIYLPASLIEPQKKPVLSKANGFSPEPGEGKGKVLLMDDEGIIRRVITQHLRNLKYEVEAAGNGTEAIELYKKAMESGKSFDAVVMDLTIPGDMGGKEATKRLLEIDPKTKVIVASGYVNDPIMAEFRKYGFKGVLTKPYEIYELDDMLRNVIMENN